MTRLVFSPRFLPILVAVYGAMALPCAYAAQIGAIPSWAIVPATLILLPLDLAARLCLPLLWRLRLVRGEWYSSVTFAGYLLVFGLMLGVSLGVGWLVFQLRARPAR